MTHEQMLARFERALRQGGNTHTVQDVLRRLHEGKATSFGNDHDAVIVAEVIDAPQRRMCNYWIVAGDLHSCAAYQPQVDEWGRANGCNIATATGRMGWLRLQQTPLGADWKPVGIKFAKEL